MCVRAEQERFGARAKTGSPEQDSNPRDIAVVIEQYDRREIYACRP
jgi:hypothetical protein